MHGAGVSHPLLISIVAVAATGVFAGVATTLPPVAQQREAPLRGSRQVLIVVTDHWNAVAGVLQRFERA